MTSSGPPLGHHPDCRRGARSGACPSVAAAGADGPDRGRGRRDCVSGTLDFGLNFSISFYFIPRCDRPCADAHACPPWSHAVNAHRYRVVAGLWPGFGRVCPYICGVVWCHIWGFGTQPLVNATVQYPTGPATARSQHGHPARSQRPGPRPHWVHDADGADGDDGADPPHRTEEAVRTIDATFDRRVLVVAKIQGGRATLDPELCRWLQRYMLHRRLVDLGRASHPNASESADGGGGGEGNPNQSSNFRPLWD